MRCSDLLTDVLRLQVGGLRLLGSTRSCLTSSHDVTASRLLGVVSSRTVTRQLLASVPGRCPTTSRLVGPRKRIVLLSATQLGKRVHRCTLRLRVLSLRVRLLRRGRGGAAC